MLAMVDSGCGASFVDRRFAAQHKIPLSRLEVPLEAEAIDGHWVIPIPHQTAELTFAVGGKRFKMRFHVMDCPHADFVLGHPWLRITQPYIDWEANELSFMVRPVPVGAAVPALSILPQYSRFERVFGEEDAKKLPLHSQHDIAITTEPGARIPLRPIYSMSLDKQKALREYIDENLKKGFIRKSKSPMGSPVLFVGKKDGLRRFCVDFRRLNAVTVRDAYPLPLMSSMLDRVAKGRIFTKIDLRNAYNLIRIRGIQDSADEG